MFDAGTDGAVVVEAFHSFTLALVLLLAGKRLTQRVELLRRYSIPEPLSGGILCAAVVAIAWYALGLRIEFELGARDLLLLYFFAGVGLKSDVRTLRAGGRPLLVLGLLACSFMVVQNLAGMAIASGFGMEPKTGLLLGSVSLTGGVGTTLAWAPVFIDRHGVANALELGIAGNTVGLISACVIGGPTAAWLMRRHRIEPSGDMRLDIGSANEMAARFDYFSVLRALFLLNVALMLGWSIESAIAATGLTLPTFVSCLMAGILVRNLPLLAQRGDPIGSSPGISKGLALISDIALGLFLTMALMGLQLWSLQGMFVFVLASLSVQILLALFFAAFIVFRAMGRDYEASVICSGFSGIALGSTATAVANMTAVAQQHGAAHRAFVIVPLVSGFFVDLANALIIGAMLALQ
ncbi:MAG: sodium/glutamate symporter [Limnobacter sp.]|nr:sodium/glutamate symporter [Limnobacter sp.]